jgi:hypothetical protein
MSKAEKAARARRGLFRERESNSELALEALYGVPDHRDYRGDVDSLLPYLDVDDDETRLALERIDVLRHRAINGAAQLTADLAELWRTKASDVRALNDSLEAIAWKHGLTKRGDWPERYDEWDTRSYFDWVYDEEAEQYVLHSAEGLGRAHLSELLPNREAVEQEGPVRRLSASRWK